MSQNLTNAICITVLANATPEIVQRAHAALDAFLGNAPLSVGAAVASAPAAEKTVAQASNEQGELELDASGLPHDERIHSGAKSLKADGTWTRRKNIDDNVFNTVTAELRKLYPAANTGAPAVAQAAPAVKVPTINLAPKSEYQKLVHLISTSVSSGKLDQQTVDDTFSNNGTTLAALAGDEATSKAFYDAIAAHVASLG